MNVVINRRDVLRTGAAATAFAGAQLFTGVPALADYAVGPTLRRNASTMLESDPILRGYRRAIANMRALPDTDPCSWFYQAAIHGTNDPRGLTAWNTCHTNPTFFWAWHRMYLYWFERIVRKQAGMYDWAVPYWNWTNPAERAIPAPFRNSASMLFDSTRNSGMNSGGNLSTGLATSVNNAMALTNYFNAQSSVDGPHGSVHGAIGGNMGGFNSAAKDAVFWIHHAQVDRLWNLWLAQGGGRTSPVGDTAWRNTTYTFFDECCQPVTMKGCDVVRAARQLSYAYEGEPSQVNQYCPRIWVFDRPRFEVLAKLRRPLVLKRSVTRAPLPPLTRGTLRQKLLSPGPGETGVPAIELRGIEAPRQPGISWEVHVGQSGFRPSADSLVGMFALFSVGLRDRAHHFSQANFVFAVSSALRGIDPEKLEVVFVPVTGREDRGPADVLELRSEVQVGEVNLVLDRALPAPPRDEQEALRKQEADQ